MNTYSKALAAKALKSSSATAVALILFFVACGVMFTSDANDNALGLVSIIAMWAMPMFALSSLCSTIHNLIQLKKAA